MGLMGRKYMRYGGMRGLGFAEGIL